MERCLQVDPMDKLFGDVLCCKEHQDHQSRTFHVDREIPNHINGKRETSVWSGQLLKLGDEKIKALQKDPIEWPWHEKTHFRLNIMNTKRQNKGEKGFVDRLYHDCHLDIDRSASTAYCWSSSGDSGDLLSRTICTTGVACGVYRLP